MKNYKFEKTQIEKNLQLEYFFNVEISVNAFYQTKDEKSKVTIVGEVIGLELKYDLLIFGMLIDPIGKILQEFCIKLEAGKFDGISAFQMTFYLANNIEISKIKVYPILEIMNQAYYISMQFPVIGITIPARAPFVAKSKVGDIVELLREPDNLYDGYALEVLDFQKNMLGYIAKETAYILSSVMDALSIVSLKAEIRVKKPKVFYVEIINEPDLLKTIVFLNPRAICQDIDD